MAGEPKKTIIPIPVPAPAYVKLKVTDEIRIGNAFYAKDDVIEVFHYEAVKLVNEYGDHFEVITS